MNKRYVAMIGGGLGLMFGLNVMGVEPASPTGNKKSAGLKASSTVNDKGVDEVSFRALV